MANLIGGGLILLPFSLLAALLFAWRQEWKLFWGWYGAAWVFIIAATLWALYGSTGSHGSSDYQMQWALLIMGRYLIGAVCITGLLAWMFGVRKL